MNRIGFVITLLCLTSGACVRPSAATTPATVNAGPISDVAHALPDWLPFPIPLVAYQKWRKYGEWDFKQLGSQYHQSTMFNFGATANAAGLDQDTILQLVHASRATPEDVAALDDPNLVLNFKRNPVRFEQLRAMAAQDVHLRRIAYDYTNVDEATVNAGDRVGLVTARWNDYRRLFDELSLREGIVRNEDYPDALFLIYRTKGLCTGGSSSGYVYSATEPHPLVTNSVATAIETEGREKHIYTVWVFRRLAPR